MTLRQDETRHVGDGWQAWVLEDHGLRLRGEWHWAALFRVDIASLRPDDTDPEPVTVTAYGDPDDGSMVAVWRRQAQIGGGYHAIWWVNENASEIRFEVGHPGGQIRELWLSRGGVAMTPVKEEA